MKNGPGIEDVAGIERDASDGDGDRLRDGGRARSRCADRLRLGSDADAQRVDHQDVARLSGAQVGSGDASGQCGARLTAVSDGECSAVDSGYPGSIALGLCGA